ncbi:terpene synthase [Gonapodya prolifera JEL478]|uniref:Terpene cyclase/mutase family member n=1 Tax=Gonapodya prolifera (strain JEL478) TaxID=1344416 RepID=A0A139A4F5_GONPJ|nr:terpene synthase [Gonapodya prolifera JEL478]|eukprot:KXS11604.1 terpene synthase [Gonapodya prolifera JEL478]
MPILPDSAIPTEPGARYPPVTDPSRWRLKASRAGAQTWHYLTPEQAKEWPQTPIDRYWQGLYTVAKKLPAATTPEQAARNGFEFYKELQCDSGHWAGEYGGPMFLIPGLCVAMYITGTPWEPGYREELIRYLRNMAHAEDGGWGIHIESPSTVFGTALNYTALRLLGVPADDPVCVKARGTLHKLGGAARSPAWGKFWLSVLGCYDYSGMNPVPPELWILPEVLPIHASKLWVHTRMVYLPMGYFYGRKWSAPLDELTKSLREELYTVPYEEVDWAKARDDIAPEDLYQPHSTLMNAANSLLLVYESLLPYTPLHWIRERAVRETVRQCRFEDDNTGCLDIGPVNKAMNMLVSYLEDGPTHPRFRAHIERNLDFLWLGPKGMLMNGTNGSQLWDTAFMCQAIAECGFVQEEGSVREHVLKALDFLDESQIKTNSPNYPHDYRQTSKGAWPFSTREQTYTVSDTTAEGLKTSLILQKRLDYTPQLISDRRFMDAADVLLTMQNRTGGFGSYELQRAGEWLELLNPAEVFGKIMVEYNYTECTTAVMLGLTTFRKHFPGYRRDEIDKTVNGCIRFIKSSQRPDGSYYGCWAICFTYAALFGVEALASVGERYSNSDNQKRACDFIVSKQNKDGGWGEAYKACETGVWCDHPRGSQVVNTAWAVLALMAAEYPDESVIRRGIKLIMQRQRANGEWLQEGIEGVFNRNCMISYPNYKFAFTIWALGRYAKRYGNPVIDV